MFKSTKVIDLGSCAFRQPRAKSHCSFLHGYRLTAKFWFEADELDENNWVVDFGGLKKLKWLMEEMFDHTTVISADDPHIATFRELEEKNIVVLRILDNGVGIERFAEWCCETADEYVQQVTDGRCRCVKAEVFEHEKNSAIYEKLLKPTQQVDERWDDNTTAIPNTPETNTSDDVVKVVESSNKEAVVTEQTKIPKPKGAVVNTNIKKQKNRWVDPESTNAWGL
jgi:6-pyruvoyltetrahydropterin/6-carboxytetrahydropterin synthase